MKGNSSLHVVDSISLQVERRTVLPGGFIVRNGRHVASRHLKNMEIPMFKAIKTTKIGRIQFYGSFPIVKELLFTFNFLSFNQPYLLPIGGHSLFYQFKIRKENKLTCFYVKEDKLDADWKFPMGIKLLSKRPSRMLLQVGPRSLAENNFH